MVHKNRLSALRAIKKNHIIMLFIPKQDDIYKKYKKQKQTAIRYNNLEIIIFNN